jgi:RNA polymerase sigma-70 factor (ECF subfamily)
MVEAIFERHHKTVYRVCMLYLKNPADAEDITQSVFLRLLSKTPSFQSAEHEKAWLVRAAVNACKNDLRSFRRRNVELPPALAAPEAGTGEVLSMVLALPKKYKIPLYLHYFEGYSAVEIAKMLKIRETTVRSQLMRGRNLLRLELEKDE